MADVEQFLTKKVGPAPVWVYAAGGGLLASVLFLKKKGSAVAPGGTDYAGTGSTTGPYSPSPIVITTPGTMPDGTSSVNPSSPPSVNPPPTPTPTPGKPRYQVHDKPWGFAPGQTAEPIFSSPSWKSSPIGYVPLGSVFTATGDPVQGVSATTDLGSSSYYIPYQGGYISSAAATLLSGMGGGPSVMSFVPNSGGGKVLRKTGRHAHNQFINVGMGGGGHAGLNAISKQTGVSKLRLKAMNPAHWRPGVRPHRGIIHIA